MTSNGVTAALAVLGLDGSVSEPETKKRYRTLMRANHPDVSSAESTAAGRITEAFAIVSAAFETGELPATDPAPAPDAVARPSGPAELILSIVDDDPFVVLVDRAQDLGEIVYQDPHAGWFQVLVTRPGLAPSQLTAQVTPEGEEFRVEFSLEPLTQEPAPHIEDLVRYFGRLR